MIRRRSNRSVPALNTTSTADISFMLLIFFLVTSSMDIDKGLARVLPPLDKQEQPLEALVERDQLLTVGISQNDECQLNGQPVSPAQLRPMMADFIAQRASTHLIMIDAHPQASYEAYFLVQEALMGAYRDVRNQLSHQKYGRSFQQISESQRDLIREQCPQRIADKNS